uniref:Craniofacial development protein 1 n=1 Tax=Setaria digitata TaxID=48799 RepID=A0A915PQ13_9BILA
MSGNDVENGSNDDDDYVPSDDEDVDDEENENGETSDDDEHGDATVNTNSSTALTKLRKTSELEETEDERQQRLKSLFEEFIGGNGTDPKPSSNEKLSISDVDGEQMSVSRSGVPKLAAETTNDIFSGVQDKDIVHSKSEQELCVEKEQKSSRPTQNEKKRASNGLTNAISALSKKSKMSVLEKTAQDWGAFKDETGIQEELSSHNRGKQGYVDRVEFLTRTDYRQFEIERDARNAVRKKK